MRSEGSVPLRLDTSEVSCHNAPGPHSRVPQRGRRIIIIIIFIIILFLFVSSLRATAIAAELPRQDVDGEREERHLLLQGVDGERGPRFDIPRSGWGVS